MVILNKVLIFDVKKCLVIVMCSSQEILLNFYSTCNRGSMACVDDRECEVKGTLNSTTIIQVLHIHNLEFGEIG